MSISQQTGEDCAILTRREKQVLTLAAEGKSSKQIAHELFLSKRTVDFHLNGAYVKLGVTNRIQAIVTAKLPLAN